MYTKKTITFLFIFLLIAAPILADKDKDGDTQEQYEEIDNFDFLYNDAGYDTDLYFSSVDNMLDEAFAHIGARYRAGHSGPDAFDCSGFTRYVFRQSGITLGASSKAQYAQGEAVSKGNLQSGDLVFFTSPGSGRSIGHVGIVVDVDPINNSFSFIHASNRGVVVSSSKEPFYANRYVGARRIAF